MRLPCHLNRGDRASVAEGEDEADGGRRAPRASRWAFFPVFEPDCVGEVSVEILAVSSDCRS